jgi:signal peptidase I
MLLMTILIAIIVLAGLIYLFLRRFTVIRINGASMFPTLKHGQIKLLDRLIVRELETCTHDNVDNYTNRIYVFQSPDGTIVIKRLVYVSVNTNGKDFWFEGDNPPESHDSRHYGFVRIGDIYGELVDTKDFWKRLFIL